ncbi:unnamed protein product, partial [Rotaria magnacalcarata]
MSKEDQTKISLELKAKMAFDELNKRASAQPTLVKKIGAIIQFDITKNGKFQHSW